MPRPPKFSVGSKVTVVIGGDKVAAKVVEIDPPELGFKTPGLPWYKIVVTSRSLWLSIPHGETLSVAEYGLEPRK